MPRTEKITPQQIQKAKKIIALLPKKDNGLTREEAGELLEKDFKLAFKKGYTPQEICFIFREFGITIPVKIVSKYQLAGDAFEINGYKLEKICDKFAMKKHGVSNENGIAPSENELNGREEKAVASVDGVPSRSEETAAHAPIDGVASGENCNASVENTEQQSEKSNPASEQNAAPISEKDASGGMASSGTARQNHWDDDLDMSMDDWCGPAKFGQSYG